MIAIGIDPGTITGYAEWDTAGKLLCVTSHAVDEAMEAVLARHQCGSEIIVIFEDARLRRWFGNAGRERLQGAGAAKRDAKIWATFLARHKVPHAAQRPGITPTKRSSEWFRQVTGWPGKTNEHARDAAMLVYGIGPARARALLGASQ